MNNPKTKSLTTEEAEDLFAERIAQLFIFQIRKELDEERKNKTDK
jgi:hypothetical protein